MLVSQDRLLHIISLASKQDRLLHIISLASKQDRLLHIISQASKIVINKSKYTLRNPLNKRYIVWRKKIYFYLISKVL